MAIICQVVINYLNFGKREFPSLVISKDLYEDAIIYYHSDEFSQNYADGYGKYVDDIGELVEEKNFTNFILTTGKNDLPNYRRNMVASADYLQVAREKQEESHLSNFLYHFRRSTISELRESRKILPR